MSPRRGRRDGLKLDGILLVDKPQEWTSHDVVNFVRGRYRLNKVGHGGTLDPMATGLLVLLLGKGTKCSDTVMLGQKTYEGTYTLGSTTNSQDADGVVEETCEVPEGLTLEKLEALLPEFTGDILQIPPMVSAIKKDGVPLYKLARRGEVIERAPRPVTIYSYEITDVRLPEIDVRIVCSKGTYIRTLAHDFGQRVGCGAHLSALCRTQSGIYDVENTVKVEALREMELEDFTARLLPLLPITKPEKPVPSPSAIQTFEEVSHLPQEAVVLAIGAFDGIHNGHQHVIQQARDVAKSHEAIVGVMRFFPHPSKVLAPEKAPLLLCTEKQISELLHNHEADFQLRLPFTKELANQEPEEFLDTLYREIPHLKGIIVGPNWRFGKQGRGDIEFLKQWADSKRITVSIAQDTLHAETLISSTRIRNVVQKGNLKETAEMLGRNISYTGIVEHGKKFGRELGFPTANFTIEEGLILPPSGVYAMIAHVGNQRFSGAGYITEETRLLEVHLLDFEDDLYEKEITVELVSYQRPATPISDPKALRTQIQEDVNTIRDLKLV